nr:unnamed protein product [Digitaria exilis]
MAVEKSGGAAASTSSSAASAMDRFQKIVLSWDYLRLVAESKGGKQGKGLQRVKDTYASVADYLGVFEPLLFEEVKSQIVRGRSDEEEEDAGLDWQRVAVGLCAESEGFHKFSMAVGNEFRETVSENDLLLLSKEKVCSLSTIMREFTAMHSVASLPFRDLILSAAEKHKDGEDQSRAWNVPQPLMDHLKTNLNDSQLEAVNAGLSRRSFVLIQGPPGTGKTQTILGLLSAVLHSAPARMKTKGGLSVQKHGPELDIDGKHAHWVKASPWLLGANPRDLIMPVDGDDGFYPTGNELKPEVVSSSRKYRAHVLVCAPSNSALDEIVLRVLNTGIRDENNNTYNPKIVRIGVKAHHSVKAVSMDYLIQQKLSGVDRTLDGGRRGAGEYDRIRASILDEAAIVFSTLSFSGSSIFSRMNRGFDVVIIDEAAQAVGDPVQLPATVISSTAQKLGYGTSLFKRFQGAGFPVQMLNIQYRMHPEISIFPSKEFYEGVLQDGEGLSRKRPWHSYSCFGPFCFFDVDGIESQPPGSGSWVNQDEVEFITLLYHQLAMRYPELKSSSEVAVISPYRQQIKLLRDNFRLTFGDQSKEVIDVNTVDGFQVVGSASTLQKDEHWNNLVESAKERNCYFKVPRPFSTFFSEDNLETMAVKKPEPKVEALEGINEVALGRESMNLDDTADQADAGDDDDDAAMDADDGGGDD